MEKGKKPVKKNKFFYYLTITLLFFILLISVIRLYEDTPQEQLNKIEEEFSYLEYLVGDKVGYVVLENGTDKLYKYQGYPYYTYSEGDTEGLLNFIKGCKQNSLFSDKNCIIKGTDNNFYKIYRTYNFLTKRKLVEIDKDAKKIYLDKGSLLKGAVKVESNGLTHTPKSKEELYKYGVEFKHDIGVFKETDIESEMEKGKANGYDISKIDDGLFDDHLNNYILHINISNSEYEIIYSMKKGQEFYEGIQERVEKYIKKAYDLSDKDLREIYKVGEYESYKGVYWGKLLPTLDIPFWGSNVTMYKLEGEINKYEGENARKTKQAIEM